MKKCQCDSVILEVILNSHTADVLHGMFEGWDTNALKQKINVSTGLKDKRVPFISRTHKTVYDGDFFFFNFNIWTYTLSTSANIHVLYNV